jgi:hypothetical protein
VNPSSSDSGVGLELAEVLTNLIFDDDDAAFDETQEYAPSAGTAPRNNNWGNATTILSGGSYLADLGGATVQTLEPALPTGATTGSIWYTYLATAAGTLTLRIDPAPGQNYGTDGSGNPLIDVYTGSALASLDALDYGTPVNTSTELYDVAFGIAAGVRYYIRATERQNSSGTTPTLFYLRPNRVARQEILQITLIDEPDTTPGYVVINIGNGAYNDIVHFTIDNDDVRDDLGDWFYVTLNGTGSLTHVAVPVPELPPGAHQLIVNGTHRTATLEFQVGGELFPVNNLPADSGLGTVADSAGKWQLIDPVPGGETYVMEVNPRNMASPNPSKILSQEMTTASDGQLLEWEASSKAATWSFSGAILGQADLDALYRFADLDRRFWLVDHFRRAWVVTLEEVAAEPQIKAVNYPYFHRYKVDAIVWAGPVNV